MGKNHNACNCVRQCPCYPNCDRMMKEGQIPRQWLHKGETENHTFLRTDIPFVQREMLTDADEMLAELIKETVQVPEALSNRMQRKEEQLDEIQQMEQRTATAGYADAPMTDEDERDWQKLKEMYPDMAKIILAEVENVCDSLEYEGSMMFDTIPDKERVRKLTENIYEKVKDRYPVEEGTDQDDMLVMNRENRRRYPPHQNWLNDFIQVLLFQEMHRRRCRHRRCRR